MQWQDLRHINPRDAVDRGAENEHIYEEKCDRSRGSLVFIRLALETQENRDHHHADAKTEGTPEHGASATHAIGKERWEETADDEHNLDTSTDDKGEVLA